MYRIITVSMTLVFALVLQSIMPLTAPVFGQEQKKRVLTEATPLLDLARRQKIEVNAQKISEALSFNTDGTVSLNSERLGQISSKQDYYLQRLVSDINRGNIGIAIVQPDGTTKLFGNRLALPRKNLDRSQTTQSREVSPDNGWWVDRAGVHIYVDSWWTWQLRDLQGWAISAIVGLIASALCSTGVGCIAVGLVTSFVWDMIIWRVLRPYYPDSFTIHAPWWGWVVVQTWSSRGWLNGYRFKTWLWT